MIVRMGLLRKKVGLTPEQFRKHWRGTHGPIAARLPGLRRYHQNPVVDSAQRGIDYRRGSLVIDGFSQLWFDDLESMHRSLQSDAVAPLAADEANLIEDIRIVVCEPNVVIPTATDRPLIKRMTTLKRRPDVTPEKFRHEWFDVHSFLVKRLPQVKGYTQNFVIERALQRGRPATYEELPVDGIVELWFEDVSSLQAAFASDAGRTLMTHATEFIDEITTFLVEPVEVL
ncbi:MAG TPA: EthD family reductase [Burkholderiaceae bacterium]|nr:EthD family reductase [Burkholderiaceae bacterium]